MAREEVEREWVPQETEEPVEEPYPGEPQAERQGIAGEEAELPSVAGAEQGASSDAEQQTARNDLPGVERE